MRTRDVRVFLTDIVQAAEAIAGFIGGRTLDDYCADLMLRSAVERQFEILGEAMGRALKTDPTLISRLVSARAVVDFRNVVAHEYDMLSDATVWDVARNELPKLAADVIAEVERLRGH